MGDACDVAIVGAGPYGLSLAAHLRGRGVDFRIFGRAMDSWRTRMPAGMFLKSEGFASSLYDPREDFTLLQYCLANGLPYAPTDLPVPLDTFISYALDFQKRLVPTIDDRLVVALHRSSDGFVLQLADDDRISARRVIIAVGLTYFAHVPPGIAHLPTGSFSHASAYGDLSSFKGLDVTVIGAGASALDMVAGLHRAGAQVQLVARRDSLSFNVPIPRPWFTRWYPVSGLGGGLPNQFYEHGPALFRHLPRSVRHWAVRNAAPPAGGFPVKDTVERVRLHLAHSLRFAKFHAERVHIGLLCPDGSERTLSSDHVIAGTGYVADVRKLKFLSKELILDLKKARSVPILTKNFESSIPGLYFVGLSAANTFGPSMRFLLGARFTARRITKHLAKLTA
jgi:hypothetical protein